MPYDLITNPLFVLHYLQVLQRTVPLNLRHIYTYCKERNTMEYGYITSGCVRATSAADNAQFRSKRTDAALWCWEGTLQQRRRLFHHRRNTSARLLWGRVPMVRHVICSASMPYGLRLLRCAVYAIETRGPRHCDRVQRDWTRRGKTVPVIFTRSVLDRGG